MPADSLDADRFGRERQLALARIVALHRQSSAEQVFSHESAAVVWGLPLLRTPDVTHVLRGFPRAADAASDVVRHRRMAERLVATVHRGLPVTPMAHTVVDCARTCGARGGLVVADAALAAGVRRDRLSGLLDQLSGARGIRVAREIVSLADDGAESAGESLARWAVLRAGLPVPETQVPVATRIGVFWLDIGWPEWRLGIEYDGLGKYGAAPAAVVLEEKRRQDAVAEAGWRLLRLGASDVRDPDAIARRVLRVTPGATVRALEPRRYLA